MDEWFLSIEDETEEQIDLMDLGNIPLGDIDLPEEEIETMTYEELREHYRNLSRGC